MKTHTHINKSGMTDLGLNLVKFQNKKYFLVWEILVRVYAFKLNNGI